MHLEDHVLCWCSVWEQEDSGGYCLSLMRQTRVAPSRGWWWRWGEGQHWNLLVGRTARTLGCTDLQGKGKKKDDR